MSYAIYTHSIYHQPAGGVIDGAMKETTLHRKTRHFYTSLQVCWYGGGVEVGVGKNGDVVGVGWGWGWVSKGKINHIDITDFILKT